LNICNELTSSSACCKLVPNSWISNNHEDYIYLVYTCSFRRCTTVWDTIRHLESFNGLEKEMDSLNCALRFSWQWLWRKLSSGMLHRVAAYVGC
jgi:hypothetical protein